MCDERSHPLGEIPLDTMTTRYIDVDGKWGIVIVYDFDTESEYDELAAIMRSFGLSIRNISKSLRILSTPNSGMAVSADDLRMSVAFIGDATSTSEWWSTVAHELHHISTAIIDHFDEPYYGEGDAYLHGFLLQRVVEEIAIPCGNAL